MIMEKNDFAKRLADLRTAKGVSARDMSLSLGQSAGYINNIENGVNLPLTNYIIPAANNPPSVVELLRKI